MSQNDSSRKSRFCSVRKFLRPIVISALLFVILTVAVGPDVSMGAVVVSGDSVTLKWNPSAGADGYYLLYAPYEGESFTGDFSRSIDVGNQAQTVFEIGEGEGFHVAVQAYNEAGVSGISNVVSFIRSGGGQVSTPAYGNPVIRILANGTAGRLTVQEGTPVTLSVTLDQVAREGGPPDVWIVADSRYGHYSFNGYSGWVEGVYPFERLLAGTNTFDLPSLYLPRGFYTFVLAVDDNADREPDMTWHDSVTVYVRGSTRWW